MGVVSNLLKRKKEADLEAEVGLGIITVQGVETLLGHVQGLQIAILELLKLEKHPVQGLDPEIILDHRTEEERLQDLIPLNDDQGRGKREKDLHLGVKVEVLGDPRPDHMIALGREMIEIMKREWMEGRIMGITKSVQLPTKKNISCIFSQVNNASPHVKLQYLRHCSGYGNFWTR